MREPSGSALPGIAPTNAYPCSDGILLVAGNGDSIFKRLMYAIGRADLAEAADLATNQGRVKRAAEIDDAVAAWTRGQTVSGALATLGAARVPAGRSKLTLLLMLRTTLLPIEAAAGRNIAGRATDTNVSTDTIVQSIRLDTTGEIASVC